MDGWVFLDSMWENKKIVDQIVAGGNRISSDCNIYHYRQIYLSLIPQQYFVPILAKQLYFYKQ